MTTTPVASFSAERLQSEFNPALRRTDFPILATSSHGHSLVYLDNGATTQKPRAVIDAISRYYESQNANIHRGVYDLSQRATAAYEGARETIARFINAPSTREVLFTRGTTEAINLVASSWGRRFLKAGDEVVVSAQEHHSNIVPWQIACELAGARLRVIPINDAGELLLGEYRKILAGGRVKMVSVVHLSNSLGTINDIRLIAQLAHEHGAVAMGDGAQWAAHGITDVQDLGVDFYAFSGHKLYGPTGIGILWGRAALLEQMPPYQGGGDMVESVTFEKTTYAQLPSKFEAGTPHIDGAIGLAAAVDYVTAIGFPAIAAHEHDLLQYATPLMQQVAGLRIIGTAANKGGVISFILESPKISPLDIDTFLDRQGIAVRTGHHCCQPVMDRFQISATTRASFGLYNTRGDVDALVAALQLLVSKHAQRSAAPASILPPAQAPKRNDEADSAAEKSGDEFEWPAATANTIAAAADELSDTFDLLGDRDARNEYIIDLGTKLPGRFDLLKKITPRVPGCMSEVYLVGRRDPAEAGRLQFIADANADIVRGLIAVLQQLFSGQRAADVLVFDVEKFFHRIGLDQFITSQRRNGLDGMVRRIKTVAAEIAAKPQ